MHHYLSALLVVVGFLAVAAAIPQLVKLVRLKHSVEFNLFSWLIWLIYQIISVAYSLQIKAYAYAWVNVLWSCFYLVMVVLIIKYRKLKNRRP